ncbi:MAG: hypothetical protein O3B72_10345 [Proteobacteria bacterium]|nr:hypothetical protein [Pseudomonadota bacterium]
MAETVNLVLHPQLQDGETVEAVKEKLITTLNVDQATVDSWYATENPTAILKDVEEATASKYVDAIQKCGAQCNLQPSGQDKSGWSLEQMTKADIKDFFICPSCEHEEHVERGNKIEQCPNCGLVIAKWEEKMREEAEKEKIRRRLLREHRLKGDEQEQLDSKRAELERLRALELEIMKELGIKPPSAFWRLFEQHTALIGFGMAAVIVVSTIVGFKYTDEMLDKAAYEELVAAEPSAEIQGVAPIVASAVELQQNGNQQVLTEMAATTQVMQLGALNQERAKVVEATQQLMKGVQPEQFMAMAGQMSLPPAVAKISPGEIEPARVNLDTVGGITGLQGVSTFNQTELTSMSPPLLEHGHEQILGVLTEKRIITDTLGGPDIVVDAIDEMDGSAIVNLMNSIAKDQEWDQFLLSHVKGYLTDGDTEAAGNLAERIENPVVRIKAFGAIMEEHLVNENASDIKVLKAQVRLDLDKIKDPDTRARAVLELGEGLAEAGSQAEPYESMDRVARMADDASDPLEESFLNARLAVAHMKLGDKDEAKRLLSKSVQVAGRVTDLQERISAFTRIARRYYDVRNNTLAAEILSEAGVIAATRLEFQPRSVAFGEIALAQGYIGDFPGARMSIDNAAEGEAKQQLIAKVAESLIGEGRYYEALAWMETLENETEYSRLELRLSSALFYEGRGPEALNRMEQSAPRMQRIYELSERGLLTSQYARFFARLGRDERAEQLFKEAEAISQQLKGRKGQVNLALVALDRARVFQLGQAKNIIVNELTDSVVKDPVDTEIIATERIIKNLLPESLWETDED